MKKTNKNTHANSARILCISICEEMSKELAKIAAKLNIKVVIYNGGILSDGHHHAQKVQNQYDVIISQAGTALAIQNLVQTPLIAINITALDIINAFNCALQINKNITFISHTGDFINEAISMAKLFPSLNINSLVYSNKEEFEQCIEQIKLNSNQVVMGFGGCVANIAKKLDIPYVLIKSNPKSIEHALFSAKNISEKTIHEKRRTRRLQSLIDHNREGIISINQHHVVTICNTEAQEILEAKKTQIIGMQIYHKKGLESLRTLYGNGELVLNSLLKINGSNFIVSRIPIIVSSRTQETLITFQALEKIQNIEVQARATMHTKGLISRYSFQDIITQNTQMQQLIETAKQYASTNANVLVEGETGTGKEIIAQSIHSNSSYSKGAFVAINCAAVPPHLLESELFGYEEGAFTGAKKGGKMGLFELAHKGTIFLDEVAEIPLDIQGKLLRVLQEKEVFRLGGDKVTNIDVRIIAATNKNLFSMTEEKTFRRDLLFRLNLLHICIPPLRQRMDDLPILIQHFITKYGSEYGTYPPNATQKTFNRFKKYRWPGNIRELINIIERMCIIYQNNIDIDMLLCQIMDKHQSLSGLSENDFTVQNDETLTIPCGTLKEMEDEIFKSYFNKSQGKVQDMAKMLGVSRVTVWKKLKTLQLEIQGSTD